MSKILVGGAGGAPSEGVINSLLRGGKSETVIGIGADPYDLALSRASKRYHVPYANEPEYEARLMNILRLERPDLAHFQNDLEIYHVSLIRDKILAEGVRLFMPPHDVVDTCVYKYKSYLAFQNAGVPVPRNLLLNDEEDLRQAFETLGDEQGCIWLRSAAIGGGGKGALPTNNYRLASSWIEHFKGWGNFVAAELLTPKTVTWLSIWYCGELIVAQSRERMGWTHGNRSMSGVTGVTKVGVTCNYPMVNEVAMASVKAVSPCPHGIFGVDMAYDKNGIPNTTEINISRFFTTVLFFTKAGLNMPEIFKDIALYDEFPNFQDRMNPLPSGLMWLRGMDIEPRLTTQKQIKNDIIFV